MATAHLPNPETAEVKTPSFGARCVNLKTARRTTPITIKQKILKNKKAALAQRQSNGFVNHRFRVRISGAAPESKQPRLRLQSGVLLIWKIRGHFGTLCFKVL